MLWYAVEGGGGGGGGGDGGEEENTQDRRDPKVRFYANVHPGRFFFLIDIPKMGGQWNEYYS